MSRERQKISIVFVAYFQRFIAIISYFCFNHYANFRNSPKSGGLVIGAYEVASMVHCMSLSIPGSISVHLGERGRDEHRYTHSLSFSKGVVSSYWRIVYGPFLLGKLMTENSYLLYVGRLGFLGTTHDSRDWEFKFVKSKGLKIISYLVGSDIRSPSRMAQLQELTSEENIGTYQFSGFNSTEINQYEKTIKRFALSVDTYSDLVFTAKFDQASHLTRDTKPFMYFCPDSIFDSDLTKFETARKLRIVHAPSNPAIKGTNLVRAAIRRLELEGYKFDYIEIQRMKNQELMEILGGAHILLNEFYGFMPGVLAIEGMAKSCVVLTRADFKYERELGSDSCGAWITTPPYMVYENLKSCLDNRETLPMQAARGYIWALENALASASGKKLREMLEFL